MDVVGRYGGEEFVVLAPETDIQAALPLAERIRRRIWGLNLAHPNSSVSSRVTVSIGVASGTDDGWEETLRSADEALYAAKHAGRNKVRLIRQASDAVQEDRGHLADAVAETVNTPTGAVILLVDDNLADRAMCRGILDGQGYRVMTVADGASALRLATRLPPDILVIAASLPEGSGFSTVRRFKKRVGGRSIPVLMLISQDATAEMLAGVQAGADEFLSRPVSRADLTLRVWSALRYQQEQRERVRNAQARDEHTRVLRGLLDFCQELSESTTLEQIYAHTLAATAEVSGCPRLAILLTTPDGKLQVVAEEEAGDLGASSIVSTEGSISGVALRTRRRYVINDIQESGTLLQAGDRTLFERAPAVAAPLGVSGEIVGVLSMSGGRQGRPFTQSELESIDLIASIAGSAIHGLLSRNAAVQARDAIVIALAKLAELRDDNTGRHVDRVTRLSIILALELQRGPACEGEIDDVFLADLERAAALHDIGKVAIPDAILLKQGRLTRDERKVICTHATIGAGIIRFGMERLADPGFLNMAEAIARSHHEWYDGTGYPQRLRGASIPLAARITALADVYDALTTCRVYKEAYSHEQAVRIIREHSGSQFDPAIVEAFLRQEAQFAAMAQAMRDDDAWPGRSLRPASAAARPADRVAKTDEVDAEVQAMAHGVNELLQWCGDPCTAGNEVESTAPSATDRPLPSTSRADLNS